MNLSDPLLAASLRAKADHTLLLTFVVMLIGLALDRTHSTPRTPYDLLILVVSLVMTGALLLRHILLTTRYGALLDEYRDAEARAMTGWKLRHHAAKATATIPGNKV